jgi:predicted RNA-binding protein YlqC (UPF0109 family)
MKDLLEYILTNIIDSPESLSIEEETEDDVVRFNVTLAEDDYPRVIGKRGLTIKGITDILRLYNTKAGNDETHKVYVNVRS